MKGVKLLVPALLALVIWGVSAFASSLAVAEDQKPLDGLPVVGSYENLKKLVDGAVKKNQSGNYIITEQSQRAAGSAAVPTGAATRDEAGSVAQKEMHSTTNVQVQGVDEADIVKTDGQYIYQVNRERVLIIKARPAEDMKLTGSVNLAGKGLQPREMYVDGNRLVVIGTAAYDYGILEQPLRSDMDVSIMPPRPIRQSAVALVYDITQKDNPLLLREVEVEGDYLSSRKIGDAVYLVANRHVYYYPMRGQPEISVPQYRDTAIGDKAVSIGYDKIRYFPEMVEPNYLVIAGFSLKDMKKEADISTYLGSGQNIYVSPEHLYVAAANYHQPGIFPAGREIASLAEPNTLLYKFKLAGGDVTYAAKGDVPGMVLNQFSMDEYRGYFRIAVTRGSVWGSGDNISKNELHVLNKDLKPTGKIENIAPGEKIYSVRFMGDRAYMVTFRTVDPLFVIDVKDPAQPRILGALKIPGYSDYLHPYDENHIIGFGKDTVEVAQKSGPGGSDTMAYYQGMKMALFDVTNVQKPVEKFVAKIGDRGTDSELLRNHRALLFSREKNLLAFPVTVMELQGREKQPTEYGQFAFQGAYVYNLDLTGGFALKGKITHLTGEDYLKAGHYWPGGERDVERIIYIGDTLYTLSKTAVKAHGLTDLKLQGELTL